ncbi:DUF192 domain-containing protein [Sulfobacillus thermosulfidooxidans]|uniref:DUF192 domain-containing protein n=1 Tax=Sulfobacillus thermosulfidooxidans TaxID=28034 RepID=UPI0006B5C49D
MNRRDKDIFHAELVSISNARTGEIIGSRVIVARSFWQRFKGLMGTTSLETGHGMLFPHTNSVHMFFMRYPLCVVYLTKDFVVQRCVVLKPWTLGPVVKRAYWVLELPKDAVKKLSVHDLLYVTKIC